MQPDPFSPDIPHGKHRDCAVSMLARIFAKHPDCDRQAVIGCLEHWLRVQMTLADIKAHHDVLITEAGRLAKTAAALAEDQMGLTEAILAAACKLN